MSYGHNSEADFAGSELARMFAAAPSLCYTPSTLPTSLSTSATYEPSSSPWPKADGLITLLEGLGGPQRDIALEYKRPQEGIHGLLTAMGQAHGYLHKGYHGAAIVIPRIYSTHSSPGKYVSEVLSQISGNKAIGVFEYDPPDASNPAPFSGKLHCVRPLEIITAPLPVKLSASRPKTQWVHMREGSTTRDGFFRFLQVAKRLSSGLALSSPFIPKELVDAITRISPTSDPISFLANTADDKFLSKVWKYFWFEYVLTPEVITPWKLNGAVYEVPCAFTEIEKDDGSGKSQIFEGRVGSLKETLVESLNAGLITEDQAWEQFAIGMKIPDKQNKQGVRDRAHSYREDLDSALSHLQWIEDDGRPTDFGYRYMNICERYGGANSAAATEYVGATLLQTGRYAAFLHYVYRLSEQKFLSDPLTFTKNDKSGRPIFTEESYTEYLSFLEDKLTDDLKVMRKVSGRARPRTRTSFQAELTLLRRYKFVGNERFRLGVGIPIDWELVVQALNIDL